MIDQIICYMYIHIGSDSESNVLIIILNSVISLYKHICISIVYLFINEYNVSSFMLLLGLQRNRRVYNASSLARIANIFCV